MRKLPVSIAALALTAVILSGCSASGSSLSSEPALDSAVSQGSRGGDYAGASSEEMAPSEPGDEKLVEESRAVITTSNLDLLVEDISAVSSRLSSLVNKYSGRVESRNENPATAYSNGSAVITVRIPSEKSEAALEEFKTLGEVQSVSTTEADVTLQYKDLQSRITALEAGIERLTELVATAENTEALIILESAITDRQVQLDSLKTQELYLSEQIAESTVTINLLTESDARKVEPENYLSGFAQGWESLLSFLGGLLIFLGLLTPWLIPVGILLLLAWLIRKRIKEKESLSSTDELKDSSDPEKLSESSVEKF